MTPLPPNVEASLATLRERWGSAAPRWGTEVVGALAIDPARRIEEVEPSQDPGVPAGRPNERTDERAIPTGFAALDAILGLGGFPRAAATALHGDGTSGKTTLALRAAAQAQAAGGLVAYLDLARSLDPVEAVARGVKLEWLVVLTPDSLAQAMAMAAMLLQDRTVDLLLLDLPNRPLDGASVSAATLAERFGRLTALARRAGVQLIVLEPPSLPSALAGALSQVSALRLELSRRSWIRLGRDVVGQRTQVRVARDRFGPPGREAELRILYADGGLRDACLARDELLTEIVERVHRQAVPAPMRRLPVGAAPPGAAGPAAPMRAVRPLPLPIRPQPSPVSIDATSPSPLATPAPPSRREPMLRPVGGRSARAGRDAVDGWGGAGREPVRSRDGGPGGDGARVGPQARS
jgi:RecA/RadA recombinase